MTSGSPPHGEGDHSSTATDRPSGEWIPPLIPLDPPASTERPRRRVGWSRPTYGLGDPSLARDRNPADAVLPDPVVPEERRFCGVCRAPVGRGRSERPGAVTGFCLSCGSAFSFVPRLHPGEVVARRYSVSGVLRLSSVGATYLARDRDTNHRWVVLTELADTVIDRRFLAEIDHPNIAKAYDYVPAAGGEVGYLVTEYVGGESLREVEHAPLAQVLAYGLEILSALGYLHSQGLLYPDLNPENVIHSQHGLMLVGLDSVLRMDDMTRGPSVASDLYPVGRMLAALSFYFPTHETSLPVHLFLEFDSYHRFLRRAMHEDPDHRFGSAEEMADQLTGVLREVLAKQTGEPRPGPSTLFGPPVRVFGTTVVPDEPTPEPAEVIAALPIPLVDPGDPLAARLRVVRSLLERGEPVRAWWELAAAQAPALPHERPRDWRIGWYRGLIELANGRLASAWTAFDAVCDQLPGELAPKLALAVIAELTRSYRTGEVNYGVVWRTDPTYVSAAFGRARMLLREGYRTLAISVLDAVPVTSPQYTAAQVAVIKIKLAGKPAEADLVDAAWRLGSVSLAATDRLRLSIAVLAAAYRWVRSHPERSRPATLILGCALTKRDLRNELKQCRRALARAEPPAPASRWHVFVDGVAESLAPVPRQRRRPRRSGWERIEARLHERYRKLGPPEAAETPMGKDEHR